MDRLSAVISAAALALAACDDGTKAGPPPSRVDVGAATTQQAASAEEFCDIYHAGDTGPAFAWPALSDGGQPPANAATWQWVNVWATWCKPCLEEIPRLVAWQQQLAAKPALAFVSTDEKPEVVAAFYRAHADMPPTVRAGDPDARAAWWKTLGLDGNPAIPINIFVTPAGKVRCIRAGGIRDGDRAAVDKLFAG